MFLIVTGAVCCQQQVCNCFPNGGGFVFSVFCGAFFPWGGDGRHLIVGGGGGWVGQGGGGSCEEFGVDNGKGGGVI